MCIAEDSYEESKPGNEKPKSKVSRSYVIPERTVNIQAISVFRLVSFAVQVGDHLRSRIICDPLLGCGLGIICGTVQNSS